MVKAKNIITLTLILFALFASGIQHAEASGKEPARVILVSSYHPGFSTFFPQVQGVKSVFAGRDILLDIEFMDSKRFADSENEHNFLQLLSHKIKRSKPYDVVMTADDNALLFILKHKAQLFPRQPVVFFGVNNKVTAKAQNYREDITGVVEDVSMEETLEMMIGLLPEIQKIAVISDSTTSGKADLELFREKSKKFSGITFLELSLGKYSFAEFAAELQGMDNTTAVLLLSAYVDKTGSRLLFRESLELIMENLQQPLFHLWYHGIGDGILGGKVISHQEQGRVAAGIVVRILEGEKIEDIAVVDDSPNKNVIDYRVLERYQLVGMELPEGTIVLHKPVSFYSQYRNHIWAISVFFLVQTSIIIFLINVIRVKDRTESALRESENRYFSLFAENHSIMLLIDPQDGLIVDANPAACEFYGYTHDEIVGMNMSAINRCSVRGIHTAMVNGDTEKWNHCLYQHVLADGEVRNVETYSGPISVHGRQLIYSIVHDVTERIKAEKEKAALESRLGQAQKMEAIGTLAGGIAHDFNNILSIILGYSEMAKAKMTGGSKEDEYIEKVISASSRAKDLIRQILTFSRQGETERFPLQAATIVKEAIRMLRSTLPSNIDITTNIQQDCSFILADPTQINQVLLNLCTNAYHAMETTGGTLNITLNEKELHAEDLVHEPNLQPGAFIRLSVSDTGPGIPAEIRDKIFDPYFTTKETGKGTGLGLSIVHGIVKSYGGFISLYSEKGQGASFHIFLPAVKNEAAEEIPGEKEIRGGDERVLFVDDEKAIAELGRDMLESVGYEVTTASNSLDALEIFQNQADAFDVVITDQTMPGMTGTELAARLLEIRPDIPIILCSGYSSVVSEEQMRQMGIRKFAVKPLTKHDLTGIVRSVLDR